MQNTFTRVFEDVVCCDDCGAHAAEVERIVHHRTCRPGESRRWREFYESYREDDNDE